MDARCQVAVKDLRHQSQGQLRARRKVMLTIDPLREGHIRTATLSQRGKEMALKYARKGPSHRFNSTTQIWASLTELPSHDTANEGESDILGHR